LNYVNIFNIFAVASSSPFYPWNLEQEKPIVV